MTTPVANMVYPVANAVASTATFIVYFSNRNPTVNDINFRPTQLWFNTSADFMWILVNFSKDDEILTANWQPIVSFSTPTRSVKFISTSPYVVLATDDWLAVNVSSIPITIELPNTSTVGKFYDIKDYQGNAATNNIIVTTVGGTVTIDGSTSFIMNSNYQEAGFLFDGTGWEVF